MSYSTKYRELRKAILKRDDNTCAYCGQEATTVDHIIPISKGGVDHETNLVAACTTCNYGKKDRDAKQFAEKKYADRYTKNKTAATSNKTKTLRPVHFKNFFIIIINRLS